MDVSDIQRQLDMGEPIEHEHTKDHKLAMDIALQHLDEFPDYYTRLKKMEASAKKEHKKFKDVTEAKKMKGKDPCWKGYEMIGKKNKGGKEVPNCVPVKEETGMVRYCPKCKKEETSSECKYGKKYWDMFSMPIKLKDYDGNSPHPGNFPESVDHEYSMARSEISTIIGAAKRLKKKIGKGEGSIEAWVQSKITKAADYLDAAADYVDSGEMKAENTDIFDEAKKCWSGYKKKGTQELFGKTYNRCVKAEEYSNWRGDFGLSEDWQKVNRKDKTDGLSQAAVNAYRKENPGSKLQTAVTEKKPKGKRADRRKNFCSRMSGMKSKLTSAKTSRDPDSRINKALRRWNCN
jgi:hypothetical protein